MKKRVLVCCFASALKCGSAFAAAPAILPAPVPGVASFNPASASTIYVDNHKFVARNANRSYSISNPDSQTLGFEVRSGDHWSVDASNHPTLTPERSVIDGYNNIYASGTPIEVSYNFTMVSGAANTATWFVTGQIHNKDDTGIGGSTSPPFEIDLCAAVGCVTGGGDYMTISVGWLTANPSSLNPPLFTQTVGITRISYNYVYHDRNPIVRGHTYEMVIQAKFHPTDGYVCVYRDGVQIVNYTGPLGFGYPVYWVDGIYRAHTTNDTQRALYQNLVIIP
jgi:hypothetical protein